MRRDEQGGAVSKLFWFVVLLALLAVVADRVGDYVAERTAANELQSSQRLDSRPDVDIAGFPFLTQFADGRYDHVTASAHDLPVGTSPNALTLSTVRVDFRTVTTSRDFSTFRARSATARATVSYSALSRALGGQVEYAGKGLVKATKRFTVLGETVRPTITVKPSVARDALSFVGPNIGGLENIPPEVTAALNDVFDTDLSLKGIPFDVRVRSLTADRQGLELVLTGKNLRYTPSEQGAGTG
jgi:hypothetical protein